ncbi:p2X purinoceptor 4 [Caerostris darwini]|uniref:P2X purinoceptor 4 n=1 Tax=Caerostris darwini TaxID=1538125 RepID=A0AAV4SE05_9ARAC|nr:p2X purinoceptor 4 [Caerostris darwini]
MSSNSKTLHKENGILGPPHFSTKGYDEKHPTKRNFSLGWRVAKSDNCFFEYYTPKIVLIKNIKVGILNRFVQLAIICYIIGYAIIYNKGYQDFSPIESSVTTKVKGVVYTNFSKNEFNDMIPDPEIYRRIWDTADYIVPPSENNAFFVVTNIVITSNQRQGRCAEDPTVPGAKCISDIDCQQGSPLVTGNGVLTGKCILSDVNSTLKVCEIYGWCPVERDVNPL